MNEQFIQVQLPVREELYDQEIDAACEALDERVLQAVAPASGQLPNAQENMGLSAWTIRLVCVWGKLINFMNLGGREREGLTLWSPKSTFAEIKRLMNLFSDTLPSGLRYSAENLQTHAIERTANQFLYMHISYQQIVLFMHRFSLPAIAPTRPPKDMPQDFLTEAARAAMDAAIQISILMNEAIKYKVTAPFAGYAAFFSSIVHVHGVFGKNPRSEARSKKYLAANIRYLTKMKTYWGMFHYIAENLKELYRQHAMRGAPALSGSDIFQYGDWFDRYPHGVSRTDYEGPAESPGSGDPMLGQKSDLQSVEDFFAELTPPSKSDRRKSAKKAKNSEPIQLEIPEHIRDAPPVAQAAMPHLEPAPVAQDALGTFDPGYFQLVNAVQPTYMADFAAQQPLPQPQPQQSFNLISPPSAANQGVTLSYSDMSPRSATHNPAYWAFNPSDLGSGVAAGPDQASLNPSAAWFLPFNMDPPSLASGFTAEGSVGQQPVGNPLGNGVVGQMFDGSLGVPVHGELVAEDEKFLVPQHFA